MNYEVVENSSEWIVCQDGVELARFEGQDEALAEVGRRLREAESCDEPASLSMRFQSRS
jgi:hypothetical protein